MRLVHRFRSSNHIVQRVGWVERSETHRGPDVMGFARAQPILRNDWFYGIAGLVQRFHEINHMHGIQ